MGKKACHHWNGSIYTYSSQMIRVFRSGTYYRSGDTRSSPPSVRSTSSVSSSSQQCHRLASICALELPVCPGENFERQFQPSTRPKHSEEQQYTTSRSVSECVRCQTAVPTTIISLFQRHAHTKKRSPNWIQIGRSSCLYSTQHQAAKKSDVFILNFSSRKYKGISFARDIGKKKCYLKWQGNNVVQKVFCTF